MSGAKNVFALVLVVFFAVGTAYGDFDWTAGEPPMSSIDPDSSPQGYGYPFEVYDATGEYSGGQVTVNIYTNYNPAYPPTGTWRDSYMTGNADEWQPGDLYIAYAPQGTTVWEPEKFFAVGVGDHGNVVDQAYSGTWQYTKQGHVYSVSDLNGFATGTYEGYDDHIDDVVPPDPDSSSPAVPLPGDEALPSRCSLP